MTLQQCLLTVALAVSVVMTWVAAVDSHPMALVFVGEACVSVWLLVGTMAHRRREEDERRSRQKAAGD